MRDGVMDVEEIERFGFKDFEHFRGEGQGIGRMVEERVGGDFDFVEANVAVAKLHADRRGIADEMDLVAAGGKLHAKLGGDNAGAAIGGIAGDADSHGRECWGSLIRRGVGTTRDMARLWAGPRERFLLREATTTPTPLFFVRMCQERT